MRLKNYDLFTRLVRTRPLFLAAAFFLTGCILGYRVAPPLQLLWLFLLLTLTASFYLRKSRFCIVLVLIAMLPLGALRFEAAWNATKPFKDQVDAQLSGRICKIPEWNIEDERTICVLDEISINGSTDFGRLRLYLRGDTQLLQQVELGQQITCTAHIWQADEATNPGQFNFSNYLRLNGLRGYATAVIDDSQFSAPVPRLSDLPERIRATIGRRLDCLFPENSALARAFLLGDKSELSSAERESYSISGAAHILAVSGMHVSVLAAAISLLLGRFLGKKLSFSLTIALLLLYGGLIGFSASLSRAIVMFSVFSLAPIIGRYSDSPTCLALAMLIQLLFHPESVLEAGFILSYGATAGIIFLSDPLCRMFRIDGYLAKRTDVGFVSLLTKRLPRWIVRSLMITLAAQLAILPAVVHFFGAQPLWSFIVNLFAVPVAMAAYILSIFAALTGFAPIAFLADTLFSLLNQCVLFFSELPFAALHIARFPALLIVLCAFSCFFASDLCKLPGKLRGILPFTVIIAVFLSNGLSYLSTLGCSVVFLDAGQADCAVIRTQGQVYLVDTGDEYSPAADYLSAMNYHVDGVFLSHPHTDHAGGLEGILDVCTPNRIYLSRNWNLLEIDEIVSSALKRAESQGSELIFIAAGDEIPLSDKTLLEVLSPSAGISPISANDDSLILRVDYGQARVAFTGDAQTSVCSGKIGDIDLLKVAHHGGQNGTNVELLVETSPSVAVIPVGYNTYGHPSSHTLELFRAAGTHVFQTDLCGAITCRLNEDGSIDVQTHHVSEVVNGLE